MVTAGISAEHFDELLNDPSMQKLSHDDRSFSYIEHPFVVYYSATVESEFVGSFMLIENSSTDCEIHILLLPRSARHLRKLCGEIIEEAFKYYERISAVVMDDLKTIQNLVVKLGFKKEGIKRMAYKQNGIAKDLHLYGLLKYEWRAK